MAVVSCGPCGLPLSIAYGDGWSGQWLCAGPHPANISPSPLRPRAHTYTGGHWPCRSVRIVPRARTLNRGRGGRVAEITFHSSTLGLQGAQLVKAR